MTSLEAECATGCGDPPASATRGGECGGPVGTLGVDVATDGWRSGLPTATADSTALYRVCCCGLLGAGPDASEATAADVGAMPWLWNADKGPPAGSGGGGGIV